MPRIFPGGPASAAEGGSDVVTSTRTLNFDASDFNITDSGAGVAAVALAYGTSAGTPAEGNHTHTSSLTVAEGGVAVDATVTTIDFDASDFNVTESPEDTVAVALAYGTSAGTPAEGNHTHASTLTVAEGGVAVDASVTTIDFDASDFTVTESPEDTVAVALAYGTSAGTPAEGNHTHTSSAGALVFVIDGGGSAITTGVKGDVYWNFAATITGWKVLLDQSGSIAVDVWKDSYANYPPTVADTIAGSEKPTVSAATKAEDTSLSSFTTAVSAGDIWRFNVDSIATATRATLVFTYTRTVP